MSIVATDMHLDVCNADLEYGRAVFTRPDGVNSVAGAEKDEKRRRIGAWERCSASECPWRWNGCGRGITPNDWMAYSYVAVEHPAPKMSTRAICAYSRTTPPAIHRRL